ncbi:helix-turn-helix domain-containing protein [Streptomyces afghaniensis]|uniref:helix-turn-helix domain-containing protein n=1 Tax=Streptomyces afghaniensis TaxID=66865 RepID=UPI0037AD2DF8
MKELAGRLTALDPDAGAAVRVIAYFDRLAETRAGVEALVRGAAVLSGCPARLVDPERRVHVRVEPDGTRRDTDEPPDPTWPSARLSPDGTAALWLERGGAASGVVDTGRAGSAPGVANADRARAASQVSDTGRGGAAPYTVDSGRAGVASPVGAPDRTAPAPGGVKTDRAGAASGVTETSRAAAMPGVANADRARAAAQAVDTGRAGSASRVGHVGQGRVASSVVDAVILERAAGVLRLVLDRTRGRVPADDPALVETLLDDTAPESARLHAARRLGLDTTLPARALAPLNERPRVVPAGTETDAVGRLGVGPAVPVLELPRSWAEARTALRFTAEGTPQDPGPRVVHAEELGGIALLADLVVPGAEPPPDVRALETAAATTPWLPATLHAVAHTASLRAAAAEINVHHSTLQDRLAHAEHLLGWPVRTPQGRLRLQLALAMRHLARS